MNRKHCYKIKKRLYKAAGKCHVKTPKGALGSSLRFLSVQGRWKWMIFALWIAHCILFLLCSQLAKKIMAYVRLQLNLLSPHTSQSVRCLLDHPSPPLPPPSPAPTLRTSFMNDTLSVTIDGKLFPSNTLLSCFS